jgi:hypothetical protein
VLWQSQRFNSLPSDEGRYLYLYLLTNEYQNSAGCYRLRDGTACDDLQWTRERYVEAREQLMDADLIGYDSASSVIRIKRWFKHNPPMNDDHYTGIVRVLERLPSEDIASAALEALAESWESVCQERASRVARREKPTREASNGHDGHIPERLQTSYLAGRK